MNRTPVRFSDRRAPPVRATCSRSARRGRAISKTTAVTASRDTLRGSYGLLVPRRSVRCESQSGERDSCLRRRVIHQSRHLLWLREVISLLNHRLDVLLLVLFPLQLPLQGYVAACRDERHLVALVCRPTCASSLWIESSATGGAQPWQVSFFEAGTDESNPAIGPCVTQAAEDRCQAPTSPAHRL